MTIHTMAVTTQRIHLLPQLVVILLLNQLHMLNMRPLCVQKHLDLKENLNTLSNYQWRGLSDDLPVVI